MPVHIGELPATQGTIVDRIDMKFLTTIDLSDNKIMDLEPLVFNYGLEQGDWLILSGNPLSEGALESQIPILERRGVHVILEVTE